MIEHPNDQQPGARALAERIKREHTKVLSENGDFCHQCGQDWSCDAIQLADAVLEEEERWKGAEAFQRGKLDCYQDQCENVPFGSVGGLGQRHRLILPAYIEGEIDAALYRAGYKVQARDMYGEDWKTCEFSWKPALTIGVDDD